MKPLKKWIGPIVGIVLLVVLIVHYDARDVLVAVGQAKPGWLFVFCAAIIVSTLLGALNMYLLFPPQSRAVSFSKFLSIYWFSWALALVVPGQVADVASISLLLRRQGVDIRESVGLLLIDKILSLIVILCYASIGLWIVRESLPESTWNLHRGLWALLWVALGGVFLIAVFYSVERLRRLRVTQFVSGVFKSAIDTCVRYPRAVLRNLIITVVKVTLNGFAFYAVFQAIEANMLSFFAIAGLAMASALVAYLPLSFNGLGTVELTGVLLFSLLGVSAPVTISAFLILRVLTTCLAWLPCFFLKPTENPGDPEPSDPEPE